MIDMTPVESSNVVAVGYSDNTLYVKYSSGMYKYDNVPKDVAEKLLNADSKGRFMNDYIKGSYTCTKLNPHQ